jgi:NADH dehydrogenase
VPEFIARHASRAAELLGLPASIQPILDAFSASGPAAADNALPRLLTASPTSLDAGLRRLIHGLDEVTPAQGVGSVQIKRFRADITGSNLAPEAMLRMFRERFGEIMPTPIGVEPAAPATRLEDGAVITIALPGRGHVEVRVREVTPDHVIVATLRGHAVAGIVRFSATAHGESVRFEVTTCDAAANALDWLTLSLGGARIQDANWTRVVSNVVEQSGGRSGGVSTEVRTLDASEAGEAEQWIRDVIAGGRDIEPC